MFVNSDFSDLLRLFNAGRVRYLVVGGYAVVQYAESSVSMPSRKQDWPTAAISTRISRTSS